MNQNTSMTTVFAARLYVPDYLKAFYFQNDSLHHEYTSIFRAILYTRMEKAHKRDIAANPKKYEKFIEIRTPDNVVDDFRIQRVQLGRKFEECFRVALTISFKRCLYNFVEAKRLAGFKEVTAINMFILENNLQGVKNFGEQNCIDHYREFRKKYKTVTRFRNIG